MPMANEENDDRPDDQLSVRLFDRTGAVWWPVPHTCRFRQWSRPMAWEPWDDDYYGRYYPPSRPLPTKGGIKARSQRGEFAASWWGRRWIAVLESFGLGARLNRGRSYARRGQVVHLEIKEGALVAGVQGSRADPYSVHIRLKQISNVQRGRLGAALADDIAIAARLMAGELPPELERCFAKVGAPLFPGAGRTT